MGHRATNSVAASLPSAEVAPSASGSAGSSSASTGASSFASPLASDPPSDPDPADPPAPSKLTSAAASTPPSEPLDPPAPPEPPGARSTSGTCAARRTRAAVRSSARAAGCATGHRPIRPRRLHRSYPPAAPPAPAAPPLASGAAPALPPLPPVPAAPLDPPVPPAPADPPLAVSRAASASPESTAVSPRCDVSCRAPSGVDGASPRDASPGPPERSMVTSLCASPPVVSESSPPHAVRASAMQPSHNVVRELARKVAPIGNATRCSPRAAALAKKYSPCPRALRPTSRHIDARATFDGHERLRRGRRYQRMQVREASTGETNVLSHEGASRRYDVPGPPMSECAAYRKSARCVLRGAWHRSSCRVIYRASTR